MHNEKEASKMTERSKRAQEVRERRMNSKHLTSLKEVAEITFFFILDEFDRKTLKKDYSSVKIYFIGGVYNHPYIYEPIDEDIKKCENVSISSDEEVLFLELLEKMFNEEEGYTAKVIIGTANWKHPALEVTLNKV